MSPSIVVMHLTALVRVRRSTRAFAATLAGMRAWISSANHSTSVDSSQEFPYTHQGSLNGGAIMLPKQARAPKSGSMRHGHAGDRQSPEYTSWIQMRRRCYSKIERSYPSHGGRGIIVCDRWLHSFDNFLSDMGQRPKGKTLDRINNDGNYEPGNVRWATASEQQRNRRTNRKLTIGGETRLFIDWVEIAGVSKSTFHWRLKHWPEDRWLEPPANTGPRRHDD